MHVSSLARKAGRGSAVGWFLVLLLICGAGAGYYLYPVSYTHLTLPTIA